MGDDKLDLLQRHCAQLSEHFDTVQIFCTKHVSDEAGTESYHIGCGNYYARKGQVNTWLKSKDAFDCSPEIKDD